MRNSLFSRRLTRAFLWVVVVGAVAGAGSSIEANCTDYPNSRAYQMYGTYYCALTGAGCAECDDDGGNSCDGGDSCTPRHQT